MTQTTTARHDALRYLEALEADLPDNDGGMSRLWALPLDELQALGDTAQQHLERCDLTDLAHDDIEGQALAVALRFAWEWSCDVRDARQLLPQQREGRIMQQLQGSDTRVELVVMDPPPKSVRMEARRPDIRIEVMDPPPKPGRPPAAREVAISLFPEAQP